MNKKAVDIILPCYNPPETWAKNVVKSFSIIQSKLVHVDVGLVIVNDGSNQSLSQKSLEILKHSVSGIKIISYVNNQGKGFALRKGVETSTKPIQIYTDIDFPYFEKNIMEMYHLLANDEGDVIIGIRDEGYYKNIPAIRKVISKLLKFTIKSFLTIPTSDTQAGLKGFNKKGRSVFLKTKINRYLFDLEFVYLASKITELKIKLHPIRLKDDVVFSKMNWKILLQEWSNFLKIAFKN